MLKGLAYCWTYLVIVPISSTTLFHDLRHQPLSKTSVWSRQLFPSIYLALVIFATSPHKKLTIPLNPSVWVLLVNPTFRFPKLQTSSNLCFVFIDAGIVIIHWFG